MKELCCTVDHLIFSCPSFLRYRIQTAILLGLTHLNPTSMARLNLSMVLLGQLVQLRNQNRTKTRVYGYDLETKRQSMGWKGKDKPRTKKSRIFKSKNKVLLVAFFDMKGIVHYEYLEEGQTINKESFLNIMRRVRELIQFV
ncbi:CLCN3 [Cordylochernes scorpioides]|uniref:CLCN3 n=1 Tax=Cordylochernes scorpioides TaxID=51811 RepID=A0ABY6LFT6_9ARAC|nr:CLCN3 [Cordylochernes scorpioides]